ncbi:type I toxin-antitoxin system antitoxin YafN [Marinobacterium sedimentorum]|uniref:type I toxin-antitoxin system antitoxin YafN n=1 Tax=Marinobacterium sedimentorum TaxID=2927804 RepID=UPI0020C6AC70|nr:type I toxin-antitoxin system antitoxin YafN [Marinobacterium sedimentorum]MCP8687737.1 type I toxin-antitoxin system antitoxin YafN [Marinobacterium sedimentorum]
MTTQTILTEKTVSITEMRKNPTQYFTDEPVAVLAHNRPAGYMVSTQLFETFVKALEREQAIKGFQANFRPSAARLDGIARTGNELIQAATDEDLGDFTK